MNVIETIQHQYLWFFIATFSFLLIAPFAWKLIAFQVRKYWGTNDIVRWRYRFEVAYTKNTPLLLLVEAFALLISLASFIIFLYLAVQVEHLHPNSHDDENWNGRNYYAIFEERWVRVTEFIFSLLIICDFMLHFIITPSVYQSFYSLNALVDLLTILPAMYSIFTSHYFYGFEFLRIVRIYTSVKVFLQYSDKSPPRSRFHPGVASQVSLLVLTVIVLVFSASGFIWVVENKTVNPEGKVENFFECIYFIVITITTLGFGDIFPTTIVGKLTIIWLVITGVSILPRQIQRLSALLSEQRDRRKRHFRGGRHINVIAHDIASINHFLKDFFHPDRDEAMVEVCVLVERDRLPSKLEMKLNKPLFKDRVEVLIGTPLEKNDLKRCRMEDSLGCFIFCEKFTENEAEEDAKTAMEALAIRRFNRKVPLHAQFKQKEFLNKSMQITSVLSIKEMRMGMLAMGSLVPGFLAFSSNLIKLRSTEDRDTCFKTWKDEYLLGAGNEIYTWHSLERYAGLTFSSALLCLAEHFGILLVGILAENSDGGGRRVWVNPGKDYILQDRDQGIVFAQNEHELKQIQRIPREQMEKFSQIELGTSFELNLPSIENMSLLAPISPDSPQGIRQLTNEDETPSGHFLIVSYDTSQAMDFLRKLKLFMRKDREDQSIVILGPEDPELADRALFSTVPHLFFHKGSFSQKKDLGRVGAHKAANIVILGGKSPFSNPGEPGSFSANRAVDAPGIMLFRNLQEHAGFAVLDLVHESSAKLVADVAHDENPHFLEGQIFEASCVDNLLAQSCADTCAREFFESVLCNGSIIQISIEKDCTELKGKQYKDLLLVLLSYNLIPLALYRTAEVGKPQAGQSERLQRYIVTNPLMDTVIRGDDVVLAVESCAERKMEQPTS